MSVANSLVGAMLFVLGVPAEAQQPKPYRVGVVFHGGEWNAVIVGLRDGLRELGLEDGKQYVLEIRNTRGDLKAVNEVAKDLEKSKVDLIYAVATSVALRVRDATSETPIVFCAGTDPVSLGLVESFAKPGGRLSGVHFLATDLTPKRLEILKQIHPKLRAAW